MFRSYLKTTLRNIRKNPLTSFINIFGLAMGLGVAIMVYAFVSFDLSMNQFHENRDEIYAVISELDRSGDIADYGIAPAPLAEVLRNDFPQIEQVVRYEMRNGVLKSGLKVFNQSFAFTDPEFLDMFSFPLAYGSPDVLREPNKIILSEQTAVKYFGDANPVGQAMTFDFGQQKYTFEVGGVAEKFPDGAIFQFEVLVNFDQLKQVDPKYDITQWHRFYDGVFLRIKDEQSIETVAAGMQPYVEQQNQVQKDWPASAFKLMSWKDLYVDGEGMRSTITGQGDQMGRLVLTIIGIFVLVLAIFNYINIAIVSGTKRLKEIGVRKVMGSTRKSLINQFLIENIILCLMALAIGVVLAITLLVPGFNYLFDAGLVFKFNKLELWIFLTSLVVLTGLLSGAYPAFYISKFNATSIFRGNLKFGGKSRLTKVFLTFQYILATIAVVGGILFTQNTSYQKEREWGYDQELTISAQLENGEQLQQLRNVLNSSPYFESLASSNGHVGRNSRPRIIETLDRKLDVTTLEVGVGYIETMGLEMIDGRTFEKNREADFQNVVVNETMASQLNIDGALGESFKIDSTRYTVVGIVKDFHQWSFYDEIEPMILRLTPEDQHIYLTLRSRPNQVQAGYEKMEEEWANLFPEKPFGGFYQESTFAWYFRTINGHAKLMQFVAGLCIILSCLGLYGLVSLNVASRTKEFSIRKALGADLKSLMMVINKQFIVFLTIALVLGVPISFQLMSALIDSVYAYHKPITWLPFVVAAILVVIMVFITVSSQIRKVMSTSPTEGLRSE